MGSVIFIALFSLLLILFLYTGYQVVVHQQYWFLIVFLAIYLATYTTFQSFAYQQTHFPLLVKGLQSLKELIILSSVLTFLMTMQNLFTQRFQLLTTDKIFILFLCLCGVYAILPIGAASFLSKLLYLKNILLPAILYFLARNISLEKWQVFTVLKVLLVIIGVAFLFSVLERVLGVHLHTLVGYGQFNDDINLVEPNGHYGLSWTFETSSGRPRYGSIFANPLELSASSLIGFATAFILLMKTPFRDNQVVYFGVVVAVLGCFYLAFSRASMMALVFQITFVAFLFKYYRLLWTGAFGVVGIIIYISYFASDELRYFVIDTLTFQNPSSLGHALEWIEGVESMTSNPLGIGLGMSGNAGSVDDAVKVGGENQFIIYGVQLGVIGMLIYIALLISAIRTSIKACTSAQDPYKSLIPFIAATTKFGLLLPLFTSNAELYLFVSYISWWMVGYSVRQVSLSRIKLQVGYG
ncbi:MAG: O-antigen ligase domain-containing protein [Cyclobacteriaceae bacterium]